MLDAFFAGLSEHLKSEWAAVMAAPAIFFFALLGCAVLVYLALRASFATRLDGKDSQIATKEAHIAFVGSQLAEYKDKLSGATPDQAAESVRALRDDLDTARKEIKMLTDWHKHFASQRAFTRDQEKALVSALSAIPDDQKGKVFMCSVNEPEPQEYAFQILRVLQSVGICQSQTKFGIMMLSSPDETGILVVVQDEAKPPPQAVTILNAFIAVGADAKYDTADGGIGADFCNVMVSYKSRIKFS